MSAPWAAAPFALSLSKGLMWIAGLAKIRTSVPGTARAYSNPVYCGAAPSPSTSTATDTVAG
jgi:hypothetical protein